MNTMLGDHRLTDTETERMAEAAQRFHDARAKADQEYAESVPSLAAWHRWNDTDVSVGPYTCRGDTGMWRLDDVTDDDIESAAAALSPPPGRDLPALLAFVFGLVIATSVWVCVLLDLARVRH